jgi:beta-glucosidase
MMVKDDQFPPDFLWGTATAAHQVEGGNHLNDWWDWEQGPGRIRDGQSSDPACDHYHRFEADFDVLAGLHQNAHRLSIEWSRIEPRPGEFSATELQHYRQVLGALHARHMTPMVTLFHYTLPQWLARQGGWENPQTPDLFARFCDRAAEALGDLTPFWCTLNEPTGAVYQGYILGAWPPGERDFNRGVVVLSHLLRAHWLAYERLKARWPQAQVGLAHHLRIFDPLRPWHPADRAIAALYQRTFNGTLLRSLRNGRPAFPLNRVGHAHGPARSQDYLGLNYYTRNLVRFNPRARLELYGELMVRRGAPRSDQGFEIYPHGLYRWLRQLKAERLPVYITENGVADAADRLRPRFLVEHLQAALRGLNADVPLRGYFHWSCFDNFEWADGYSLKFGLASCDLKTQERRLRRSGTLYGEICRTGRLPTAAAVPAWPSPPPEPLAARPN